MTEQDLHALVTDLLKHMGLAVNAEVSRDEEFFRVNLTGKDARLFDRPKDNKIGALIVILKLMVKQKFDVDPKIALDINNQRQQKMQNIVQFAKKKAEMVRVSGFEEEMPPMSPAERRAVHMALKEMSGIRTESRGADPHRRIVLIPEHNDLDI